MTYAPYFPSLYNNAAAGFVAGVQSQRLKTVEASGSEVVPTDFEAVVASGFAFAEAVDSTLAASSYASLSPLTSLISASNVTQTPSNAAKSNAAESLPSAMLAICKAAWDPLRGLGNDPLHRGRLRRERPGQRRPFRLRRVRHELLLQRNLAIGQLANWPLAIWIPSLAPTFR